MQFLEMQFPCGVSEGSTSGSERRTDIVISGSGYEERNARWQNSRRVYNAGFGVKGLEQISEVIDFFEQVRGRLYGFRWKDYADYKSCAVSRNVTAVDQVLGYGDNATQHYRLTKTYGAINPWIRYITKPVVGTVRIAFDNVEIPESEDFWEVDTTSGIVSFMDIPPSGVLITCGYEFDVPCRFDTDSLVINVKNIMNGIIQNIPVVEVKIKLAPLPATNDFLEGMLLEGTNPGTQFWLWEDGTIILWEI